MTQKKEFNLSRRFWDEFAKCVLIIFEIDKILLLPLFKSNTEEHNKNKEIKEIINNEPIKPTRKAF